MSYGLLWLAGLAYSLLIVATLTAIAARCKKPLWRRLWPILTAIIVFFPLTSFAVSGGFLLKNNLQPKWLFWYGILLSLAYIISVIIILKKGLKGSATDLQNAKFWPRLRLAAAFGVTLFTKSYFEIESILRNQKNESTIPTYRPPAKTQLVETAASDRSDV